MNRNFRYGASAILLAVCSILASCDQWSGTQYVKSDELKQLNRAVENVKEDVLALDKRVTEHSLKILKQEWTRDSAKTTAFDPSEPKSGYSKIESSTGFFLVSLQNVQPYLDGQRVTLHIGNPLAVTYSGFKIKAIWSSRLPKFDAADREFLKRQKAWETAKQEKEIALAQDLRPGTWNTVSFVVAPAKADEFGYLEIGIETNQVKLFGGR